jgi:hypothetical protein
MTTTTGWRWRETAGAVAIAAVIAALGGAAIYAATEGSSHTFGPPHQAFGPGGGPGGPGGAMGGPAPAAVGPTSLHAEFVMPDGAGSYTTVLTQTGAVTAVSPSSVTVRSDDNYTQTYALPPTAGNAGSQFAVDEQVIVRATRAGQTATVTNIARPPQN